MQTQEQQGQAGTTSSITLQDGTQLDPKVVKVMKTIRKLESGGDFNAIGDNGSSMGAYQWNNGKNPIAQGDTPINWKIAAKSILKDENAPMTPANQNKVAYYQIKAYKDAGRTPAEIDALWNGAHKDTSTGLYVHNSSERAKSFEQALSEGQTQTEGYNPKPFSNPQPGQVDFSGLSTSPTTETTKPEDSGIGQQLLDRTNQAGTAIKEGLSGKINPFSSTLQTVGAVAGGIGDVSNAVLENTPIVGSLVKGLESVIGSGVKSFMGTDTGQSVAKAVSDFTTQSPEIAGDIGAGVNIISAIPILKGIGVAKDIALNSVAKTLKSTAEKTVVSSVSDTLSRTISGRKTLKSAADLFKTATEHNALPDIVSQGGRRFWNTEAASQTLNTAIDGLDDRLTAELAKGVSGRVADQLPISTLLKQAEEKALSESIDPSGITSFFKNILERKYPTGMISLDQMNMEKRLIARKIADSAYGDPLMTTNKTLRKTFQTAVEDGAKSLGLEDVNALNKEMGKLIKTQDMFDLINTKPIKEVGLLHQLVRGGTALAGEAVGKTVGLPVAGAIAGTATTGYLENKLSNITGTGLARNLLKRATVTAKKPISKVGTIGLLPALMAQKANR